MCVWFDEKTFSMRGDTSVKIYFVLVINLAIVCLVDKLGQTLKRAENIAAAPLGMRGVTFSALQALADGGLRTVYRKSRANWRYSGLNCSERSFTEGINTPHLPMSQTRERFVGAASNRIPRLINSNLVMNTVRRLQPISRVELARVSGLQPSTVSLIVEDLLQNDWLIEGDSVRAQRGRRPRQLTLAQNRCVIGVDIHPQQTSVAVADIGGQILWQTVLSLAEQPEEALTGLTKAIRDVVAAHPERKIEGIGICLPGRTDTEATDLVFAPNLRWPVVSLKAQIEKATGLRVEMDNVANACALSEVWFADSADDRDLVVVEVSEGLGTGIFVNGAIARGRGGMAGEFGHIQMADGPVCNCGNTGCWETLASNRAAVRYYSECGGTKRNMTFPALLRLSQSEDPPAMAALRRMAEHLGRGMRMVAAALAPEEIVVVGDITAAWHQVGAVVESYMREHSLAKATRLRPAYDGGTARLKSAVPLVLSRSLPGSLS